MLSPPPNNQPFDDNNGLPTKQWIDWMHSNWRHVKKFQGSNTTANRPKNGLEVGDWYYDTTLNKPIWYKSPGWIDATGAAV